MMLPDLIRGNGTSRHGSVFRTAVIVFMASALSACGELTGQVQDSVDRAIAPVQKAIDEAARRANEVGEGVNQVVDGVSRVKGAFAGSGSTW